MELRLSIMPSVILTRSPVAAGATSMRRTMGARVLGSSSIRADGTATRAWAYFPWKRWIWPSLPVFAHHSESGSRLLKIVSSSTTTAPSRSSLFPAPPVVNDESASLMSSSL